MSQHPFPYDYSPKRKFYATFSATRLKQGHIVLEMLYFSNKESLQLISDSHEHEDTLWMRINIVLAISVMHCPSEVRIYRPNTFERLVTDSWLRRCPSRGHVKTRKKRR